MKPWRDFIPKPHLQPSPWDKCQCKQCTYQKQAPPKDPRVQKSWSYKRKPGARTIFILANTKSEARAWIKRTFGQPIPPGTVLKRSAA